MGTMIKVNNLSIKVISPNEKREALSFGDIEMDDKVIKAVKSAIQKSVRGKKSVAKYDIATKQAYLENSIGEKTYGK